MLVAGGEACAVHQGSSTSNACLRSWFAGPDPVTLLALNAKSDAEKCKGRHRIAYQCAEVAEAFTRKEHPHIAYFVDVLEPACDAYEAKAFGTMFEALGSKVPLLRRQADKAAWSNAMDGLQPPPPGALSALRRIRHSWRLRSPRA